MQEGHFWCKLIDALLFEVLILGTRYPIHEAVIEELLDDAEGLLEDVLDLGLLGGAILGQDCDCLHPWHKQIDYKW
jgi:hypothetical protein